MKYTTGPLRLAMSTSKTGSRSLAAATRRVRLLHQHVSSSVPEEHGDSVLFRSDGAVSQYILNRPGKLNALSEPMINLIHSRLKEWNASSLCQIVIGSGEGRAFCAGGDVRGLADNVSKAETRHLGPAYFKAEFDLDYALATTEKPYVALLDGITMGGGVGLSIHAPFRVATEKTVFAMPETKIGYAPDVGASFFLSRLDGELGTYFALTGNSLEGHAVYEHGLATHYVPSSRVGNLINSLASLENPTMEMIDHTIEESYELPTTRKLTSPLTGQVRVALDETFRSNTIERIIQKLYNLTSSQDEVGKWAQSTLEALRERSPTSLKVALELVRRGKSMGLGQALHMEYRMATAYCNGASPDFVTGIRSVLVDRIKGRPDWQPATVESVSYDDVISRFFKPSSPYLQNSRPLDVPSDEDSPKTNVARYGLPSEHEIEEVVTGMHRTSSRMGLDAVQVVKTFQQLYTNKGGLEEKVSEVLSRKCEVVNDPGNFNHIRWIH